MARVSSWNVPGTARINYFGITGVERKVLGLAADSTSKSMADRQKEVWDQTQRLSKTGRNSEIDWDHPKLVNLLCSPGCIVLKRPNAEQSTIQSRLEKVASTAYVRVAC